MTSLPDNPFRPGFGTTPPFSRVGNLKKGICVPWYADFKSGSGIPRPYCFTAREATARPL